MKLKKFFQRKKLPDLSPYTKNLQKLAIITTTNEKHLDETLNIIEKFKNNFQITFITQTDNIEYLKNKYPDSELISAPRKGYFGITLKPKLIKSIYNKKFDTVIILYRNEDGDKHRRAELISLLTKSKYILGYDFFKKWYLIPKRYIVYNLIKPIFEIKFFKIFRALFYNITFGIFLFLIRIYEIFNKIIRKKDLYEEKE